MSYGVAKPKDPSSTSGLLFDSIVSFIFLLRRAGRGERSTGLAGLAVEGVEPANVDGSSAQVVSVMSGVQFIRLSFRS